METVALSILRCPCKAKQRVTAMKRKLQERPFGNLSEKCYWMRKINPACLFFKQPSVKLIPNFPLLNLLYLLANCVFRIVPAWGHTCLINIITEYSLTSFQTCFSFIAWFKIFNHKALELSTVSVINYPNLSMFKIAANGKVKNILRKWLLISHSHFPKKTQ